MNFDAMVRDMYDNTLKIKASSWMNVDPCVGGESEAAVGVIAGRYANEPRNQETDVEAVLGFVYREAVHAFRH